MGKVAKTASDAYVTGSLEIRGDRSDVVCELPGYRLPVMIAGPCGWSTSGSDSRVMKT